MVPLEGGTRRARYGGGIDGRERSAGRGGEATDGVGEAALAREGEIGGVGWKVDGGVRRVRCSGAALVKGIGDGVGYGASRGGANGGDKGSSSFYAGEENRVAVRDGDQRQRKVIIFGDSLIALKPLARLYHRVYRYLLSVSSLTNIFCLSP